MAQGDRVMVVNGSGIIGDSVDNVTVYVPRRDSQGEMIWDISGQIASVQRMGGVKARSSGTIAGPPIRVRSEEIITVDRTAGLGGVDLVELFPVWLDFYQQAGWFPSTSIRIVSGDSSLDRNNQQQNDPRSGDGR